eukprot:COSAG01_NODE_36253_length_520_cov_0.900238_1_plen_69_part_10
MRVQIAANMEDVLKGRASVVLLEYAIMGSVQQMGASVMLGSSESCVIRSVRAIMGSVQEMGVSVQKDLG